MIVNLSTPLKLQSVDYCVVKLYLSRFLFLYFCVLVLMLEIVV